LFFFNIERLLFNCEDNSIGIIDKEARGWRKNGLKIVRKITTLFVDEEIRIYVGFITFCGGFLLIYDNNPTFDST